MVCEGKQTSKGMAHEGRFAPGFYIVVLILQADLRCEGILVVALDLSFALGCSYFCFLICLHCNFLLNMVLVFNIIIT